MPRTRDRRSSLGVNLPESVFAHGQDADRAELEHRWRDGTLILEIANPPELVPAVEVLQTRAVTGGVEVQVVCRHLQKAQPAEAFTLSVSTYKEATRQPLSVEKEGATKEVVPAGAEGKWEVHDRLPTDAKGNFWGTSYLLKEVTLEDLASISVAWDQGAGIRRQDTGEDNISRTRALIVPLFAICAGSKANLKADFEAAQRQLVGYYMGDDRLLRSVKGDPASSASDGLSLGLALTRRSAEARIACLPELINNFADNELAPHLVAAGEALGDLADYETVIVDYSLPPETSVEQFQLYWKWLAGENAAAILGSIRRASTSSPVNVICLGASAELCTNEMLPAPMDGWTIRPSSAAGQASNEILILYDETESSGNAFEYKQARLSTLPPTPIGLTLESLLKRVDQRLGTAPEKDQVAPILLLATERQRLVQAARQPRPRPGRKQHLPTPGRNPQQGGVLARCRRRDGHRLPASFHAYGITGIEAQRISVARRRQPGWHDARSRARRFRRHRTQRHELLPGPAGGAPLRGPAPDADFSCRW